MEDPRIRKFAQFLIRSAVGLEKGEKILIELHGSETGLMKALVQEAYAVGGKPFVHIFDYAVEGALVQGADAEHMEEIASYELERMRDMDAYIDIRATTNISMWHNVSDEAQKRYRQYYWGPIHLAERCNHTKWSVLRYPNDAMAQLAGVSTEEYEDFYFRACLVDYDKMGRAMQPLQDLMARTDKVRIVAPGTDISFSIKGIPSFGMHGNRNIPDGEIYTSPVKNSVNGHITYNVPSPYDGFLFRDVYLEFKDGKIVKAAGPAITAQCLRVPVSDGHTAAVFVTFRNKPSMEEIRETWKNFKGRAQELELPSAPTQFLHYFEEPDRPQARLDRDLEGGMAISLGRLRPDTQYDYKFVGLSHHTLRGAAGGAVLLAECAEGYI